MTNEEILDMNHNLNLGLLSITEKQILSAMIAARQDERENTIIECKNLLLKLMHDMTHVNSYPSKAVPHATILELPQLMGIKREDEREKMAGVQLCPKCNGQGTVSKPPYVPGDVHEWSSTSITFPCDVCNGAKVLLVPSAPPDVEGSHPSPPNWKRRRQG